MDNVYLYINMIFLFLAIILYLFFIKRRRAPRLFLFYLFCFIIFNESHIILSTFSGFEFGNSSWFLLGEFSDYVKHEMVAALNSYLLGIIFSMCAFSFLYYRGFEYLKHPGFIKKASLIIYLLTLPFAFFYLSELLSFIKNYGFYAVYEKGGVNGSIVLEIMFIALYALLVTSDKKIGIALLIVFSSLIYVLIGLRLEFIFKVFPVIFYFVCVLYKPQKLINKKIGWILLGLLSVIYLMQFSVNSRNNEVGDTEHSFLYDFMSQQGISINVLGMAIKDEQNPLLDSPVILAPVIEPFKVYFGKLINSGSIQTGNSYEYAISSFSLSHKLSYIEDADAYLAGFGVGGAAVAELYLFGGYLGCFIGGFLVYIFIVILERIASINLFFMLFAMNASSKMIYSPRGEFLSFLSLDRMTLVLIIVSFLVMILKSLSRTEKITTSR